MKDTKYITIHIKVDHLSSGWRRSPLQIDLLITCVGTAESFRQMCHCCEKTKNFSLLFGQRSSFHLVNMRRGNMNNYKPNMIRHTNVLGSHIKQSNQHMNSFIRAGGHTHNKISKGNMKQNKLTNIIEKQMLQLP